MFKEERDVNSFSWKDLGDLKEGRPHLGPDCPVVVYRLLQFTLRDELIRQFDVQKGIEIFVRAGKLAGKAFCDNVLDKSLDFNGFIANLQQTLKDLKIGILKVEKADIEEMSIILTVSEDLDCSGLPVSDERVCNYDEGFIAGILEAYTGKEFDVKEIDCWASGERVCRFTANLAGIA